MIQIRGLWWPADVGEKWRHSLKHVHSVEWAIAQCRSHRCAVQAGGNIGLWPRRLAAAFDVVLTFEPEPISRACLERNVPKNVLVTGAALGQADGTCSIRRQSLGSHTIEAGGEIPVIPIDSLDLEDLDFLQLDVEGYEWHALMGGLETITRCAPVIQVELRNFTQAYGHSDEEVRRLLASLGYLLASTQPGNDYVFLPRRDR